MGTIVDLRPGQTPARAKRTAPLPLPPRKPLPLRARRRRARLAQIVLVLVLVLAVVYALHAASYASAINIGTVDVEGVHALSADAVASFIQRELHGEGNPYFSRSNIFLYPRATLEKSLVANFPRIQNASVSRPSFFSRTLTVEIKEREPFARWCTTETGECYQMDAGGFIFAQAASTTPSDYTESYFFFGGISTSSPPVGQSFVAGHLSGLLALLAIIQQQTGLMPQDVAVESQQDFSITFAEGFDLKASFGAEASTLARNLKLVLTSPELTGKESQLEYIDLRFGNKVFYKLKGKDEQVPATQ